MSGVVTFEVFHTARVDYTADYDTLTKIEKEAFALSYGGDISVESFMGCPACGPYLEATCGNVEELNEWSTKIVRYMLRFKSVTFT